MITIHGDGWVWIRTAGSAIRPRRPSGCYATPMKTLVAIGLVCTCALPGAGFGEASANAAGESEPACRAVVNVAGRPVDSASGTPDWDAAPEHFVVDLRIGTPTRVEIGRGLVVRDGTATYALARVDHERSDTGPEGTSMDRSWNDLVATRLPDGEPAVWIDGTPSLVFPEPGRDHRYDESRFYGVTGVVGPHVSVELSSNGFLGGPHESSHATYLVVRAPTGERTSLDFLGPEAMDALVARVAEESERRRDDLGDSEEDLVPPENLDEVGLSFDGDGRLQLSAVLFCCTWVENRNMLEVHAPLANVPSPLAPYLALTGDPDDHGALIEAPGGCGAIRLLDGSLEARQSRSGKPIAVDLGLRLERLLGVYWLDPGDPFDTSWLPE